MDWGTWVQRNKSFFMNSTNLVCCWEMSCPPTNSRGVTKNSVWAMIELLWTTLTSQTPGSKGVLRTGFTKLIWKFSFKKKGCMRISVQNIKSNWVNLLKSVKIICFFRWTIFIPVHFSREGLECEPEQACLVDRPKVRHREWVFCHFFDRSPKPVQWLKPVLWFRKFGEIFWSLIPFTIFSLFDSLFCSFWFCLFL